MQCGLRGCATLCPFIHRLTQLRMAKQASAHVLAFVALTSHVLPPGVLLGQSVSGSTFHGGAVVANATITTANTWGNAWRMA
jgi:hypothetical protein